MTLFNGLSHKELAEWHKQLAKLTDALHSDSFCSVLVETLASQINFQEAAVIIYKDSNQPAPIQNFHFTLGSECILEKYTDSIFTLPSFFCVIGREKMIGVYLLKEVLDDFFSESGCYFSYHKELSDIADDVIGVVIDLPDGAFMVISLVLFKKDVSFQNNSRNILASAVPLMRSIVRVFWSLQSFKTIQNGSVDRAFKSFGNGVLTSRELEIITLILQGHSSKAIAEMLGITAGTVKVHRNNIYTRLGISTQSQLFSLFLNHLSLKEAAIQL